MPIGTLWLPVILSAVAVFIASSIIHMALKYHRADHRRLPSEEAVREALGKANPEPGMYFTPYCADHKQMNEPAVKEKFAKGPVAILTVYPKGVPNLGSHLALWFGFSLLVSFTAAYVARHTLMPGAPGLEVMRITGALAFTAYGLSNISDSIWKGQPWGNTVRALIDAAIYAVVTGLIFRALWPAATV
jgi:hypothetical protein